MKNFTQYLCGTLLFFSTTCAMENQLAPMEIIRLQKKSERKASLDKQLVHAASKGKIEKVEKLIAAGANVNYTDGLGAYNLRLPMVEAMHELSRNKQPEKAERIVQLLIQSGADVNIIGLHRGSPLMWASRLGYENIVKMLIAAGANTHYAEPAGYTALSWAADYRASSIIPLLARAGANVDHQTNGPDVYQTNGQTANYANTPLILAAYNDDAASIVMLLDAGADINKPNAEGQTPLISACRTGKAAAVRILVERGADLNQCAHNGQTPLMHVDYYNPLMQGSYNADQEEIATMLIKGGANIHKTDSSGCTALCYAALRGDENRIKLLLNHGAYVHHTSDGGYTPLMYAAHGGYPIAISLLLAAGACIDHANHAGKTALLCAAANGCSSTCIQILLSAGAQLNHKDNKGMTALGLAAINGESQTFSALIDNGACLEEVDCDALVRELIKKIENEYESLLRFRPGIEKMILRYASNLSIDLVAIEDRTGDLTELSNVYETIPEDRNRNEYHALRNYSYYIRKISPLREIIRKIHSLSEAYACRVCQEIEKIENTPLKMRLLNLIKT